MKRKEGLAFLERDGDFAVPCSRWGKTTSECAAVAWRFAYVLCREQDVTLTEEQLEYAMGLVVNDHDDVAHIIRTYGWRKYR